MQGAVASQFAIKLSVVQSRHGQPDPAERKSCDRAARVQPASDSHRNRHRWDCGRHFSDDFPCGAEKADSAPSVRRELDIFGHEDQRRAKFCWRDGQHIDGVITNTGDKTVIHAVVQVTFKDDMGQTAQREELPLRVLRTGGPYDEAVDFNLSPLAPGQSKPFRLTFESISAQWNRAYPELQITQVTTR